jgi:hypothetical protein
MHIFQSLNPRKEVRETVDGSLIVSLFLQKKNFCPEIVYGGRKLCARDLVQIGILQARLLGRSLRQRDFVKNLPYVLPVPPYVSWP